MSEFFLPAESAGVVDLLVRATILLCVGMVLQWLFRKWPAATRHRLWTLTFVLLLALPALRQFGPSWDLPLLPDANRPSDAARRLEVANSLVPADAGVTAAPLASLVLDVSFGRGGAAEAPLLRPWTLWVFVFWAAGCALAFASLGVGARRFSRLVRAGQPVEDEAWLSQLDALRKRLSIRVKVRLVLAVEPLTPMTGGVCHPVILLPASASHWPEARRHAVLAHELVHVHRRDALRQLIGRAALALYWFHPLGWVASHLAAARREEACDEEVLAIGARPSDYARPHPVVGGERVPAPAGPVAADGTAVTVGEANTGHSQSPPAASSGARRRGRLGGRRGGGCVGFDRKPDSPGGCTGCRRRGRWYGGVGAGLCACFGC